MEAKIIHQIGLLGEKYGAIAIIGQTNEIPSDLKPFFEELGKDYLRQKEFLEEVLEWHRMASNNQDSDLIGFCEYVSNIPGSIRKPRMKDYLDEYLENLIRAKAHKINNYVSENYH